MIQDVEGKEVFKNGLALYFDDLSFVTLTLQAKPLVNQQNYHRTYKKRYLVLEVMLNIPLIKVWNQEKF